MSIGNLPSFAMSSAVFYLKVITGTGTLLIETKLRTTYIHERSLPEHLHSGFTNTRVTAFVEWVPSHIAD
jgi:hypothetical protein